MQEKMIRMRYSERGGCTIVHRCTRGVWGGEVTSLHQLLYFRLSQPRIPPPPFNQTTSRMEKTWRTAIFEPNYTSRGLDQNNWPIFRLPLKEWPSKHLLYVNCARLNCLRRQSAAGCVIAGLSLFAYESVSVTENHGERIISYSRVMTHKIYK